MLSHPSIGHLWKIASSITSRNRLLTAKLSYLPQTSAVLARFLLDMSTSVDLQLDGHGPDSLQPRMQKLGGVTSATKNTEHSERLKPLHGQKHVPEDRRYAISTPLQPPTHLHSGTSTPIPSDAPPSVKATSSVRQHIRAQQKHRMFPTVEYAPRVSHFDPKSEHRDFRGFFVLFWIGLAIMVMTTMLRNIKETGAPLLFKQRSNFVENIWEMAFSDVIMMGSAFLVLPFHQLFASSSGWLRWKRGGVWIQSAFQGAWLLYWVK